MMSEFLLLQVEGHPGSSLDYLLIDHMVVKVICKYVTECLQCLIIRYVLYLQVRVLVFLFLNDSSGGSYYRERRTT